jgi:hypothetical protein
MAAIVRAVIPASWPLAAKRARRAGNALSLRGAAAHDGDMKTRTSALLRIALALAACALATLPVVHAAPAAAARHEAVYIDGKLQLPADYREWIYVTTGLDMSYSPRGAPGHHMFDSVFVEPSAYRAFKETGTWPDKTMFVLETRGAQTKGSINQRGYFQDADVMGTEVHVKDSARFEGGWAFFAFDDDKPASEIRHSVECYACHRDHAAVDTTFVQFYPTLLQIAKAKNTLSPAYVAEQKKADQEPAR